MDLMQVRVCSPHLMEDTVEPRQLQRMGIKMRGRMKQTAYEEKLKRLDHLDLGKLRKVLTSLQNMRGTLKGIKVYCSLYPSVAEVWALNEIQMNL